MKKNRTFSSLKPIASILPDNIKKLIKNNASIDDNIIKNQWYKILGNKTAEKCKFIKIQKYNNVQSVFVKVERKFLIEIDYARDQLIEKINSFLGYNFVNKIIINIENINSTQYKKKELKLKEKTKSILETINDEDIRKKLLKFSEKKINESN